MKILVLNCGSTSVKFRLFDKRYNLLCLGMAEKIGEESPRFFYQVGEKEIKKKIEAADHETALKIIIGYLSDEKWGVIKNLNEVKAVGHRVVYGGEIAKSALVNEKLLKKIKNYIKLAPLHNPHNLKGIEVARKIFSSAKHVAVFDTAFHQTMPQKAFIYALPYKFYKRYQIRRYGFHGTSHKYVVERAAIIIKKPLSKAKIITCHLGAGCSITAIDGGRSIDTSMGFTPLEGLVMATRTGDFDPAVVLYLQSELKMKNEEIDELVNKKSGILGLSQTSKDMRIILKKRRTNSKCKLALDIFCYRVTKYIGAYIAALGKLDALVFTAGIGENAPVVRLLICKNLNNLGIKLDSNKNNKAVGVEKIISAQESPVKVLAVPTNEEKMIAMETLKVFSKNG